MDSNNILSILSALGQSPAPSLSGQMPPDVAVTYQPPPPPIAAPVAAPMTNVLQAAAPPPAPIAPVPVAAPAAPAPTAAPAEPPRKRRSVIETIGRLADVFAKVGGAEALYEPTLNARADRTFGMEDRQRKISADEIALATGKFELGDAQNARLGQFARGLKAIQAGGGDINTALPVLGQRMQIDPETIQAVQQEIATNPNALDGLIAATTEAKQGSSSTAVQNYAAYQQILAEQGPEAAKQFLSMAQPSSQITPHQNAQLEFDARRDAREDRKLALEVEKLTNPPMTARERSDIRKLQTSMPKISSSFRGATRDIDRQIQDARKLRDHPGLAGITGALQGRIPISVLPTSNAAQALLDKISAQGTFGELQKMRNNSPTGGALGNVSDAEGKRLQAAFARLSQAQSKKDFQAGLDQYIDDLEFSKENINSAYQESSELISRLTSDRPSTPAPRSNRAPNGRGNQGIPTLSPSEAAKLPPGSRFRTSDGRVLVRQ